MGRILPRRLTSDDTLGTSTGRVKNGFTARGLHNLRTPDRSTERSCCGLFPAGERATPGPCHHGQRRLGTHRLQPLLPRLRERHRSPPRRPHLAGLPAAPAHLPLRTAQPTSGPRNVLPCRAPAFSNGYRSLSPLPTGAGSALAPSRLSCPSTGRPRWTISAHRYGSSAGTRRSASSRWPPTAPAALRPSASAFPWARCSHPPLQSAPGRSTRATPRRTRGPFSASLKSPCAKGNATSAVTRPGEALCVGRYNLRRGLGARRHLAFSDVPRFPHWEQE